MTCVCSGLRERLVLQRDKHEREPRTVGEPGRRPLAGIYRLQPTVFVDAIPELAAERSRRRAS
jgi:hypothetical protein